MSLYGLQITVSSDRSIYSGGSFEKKKSFTSYLCVFNCYLEVNCVLVSFQFVLGNFLAHLVNLVDLIGRFFQSTAIGQLSSIYSILLLV